MNPDDLADEFESGIRPARVQVLRDDLRRHTGMDVPRRVPAIEDWLNNHGDEVIEELLN